MTGVRIGWALTAGLAAVLGVQAVSGQGAEESASAAPNLAALYEPQTVSGIGAGQGAVAHDGFIYLFGDAETGVIREYRAVEDAEGPPWVEATGRSIRLTHRGRDVAPHPTGLTFHPEHGCFLGDTVKGRGRIFHIDWDRALEDADLDRAILNVTTDDLAVNGCRPEFVRFEGRWLVATSDYGGSGNQVRLYDPGALASAARTSENGVLVKRFPCGPFVQSMQWLDDQETLVLVQNQTPGLGYRFTFASLTMDDLREAPMLDLDSPTDELEGFAPLGDGRYLMLSAMSEDNVNVIELTGLE